MEWGINLKAKKTISINKKLFRVFSLPMIVFVIVLMYIINLIFKMEFEQYVELRNSQVNTSEININNEIEYLKADEVLFTHTMTKIFILVVVICILCILFLTFFTSKKIISPIKKVSYTAKEIRQNNYHNVEYSSDIQEINYLIDIINNLSNSLKKQEHIRKRLLTDLSHELKTPITSMYGHLEALIEGIWEPTKDRLISINQELLRIMCLIEQLQNLNNLENDSIKKEYIDIKALIISVIHNMQAISLSKNINIECNLDEIYANVDRGKLAQVIINMISNSIKYSNVNKKIYINLYKENRDVVIKIKDEGIGISKKDIQYIFERFYRVDKSRGKDKEGLGIGLTISNIIVKEHGGSISVNSVLNEGSEFIIRLPEK